MTQASLPAFSFRCNLKLNNIPVTPGMVKKVITYLYSATMYGPNFTSGGSEELWAWNFIHVSWCFQYMFEGVLFSTLLESLICYPCIRKY